MQSLNALSPIDVISSLSDILVNSVQPSNALSPIVVMVAGRVNCVKLMQEQNASEAIDVTL